MVDLLGNVGFRSSHGCTAAPVEEQSLTLIFEPNQGFVQGPWRLDELRGQRLNLALEPGQMGLLVQDGTLQAVFLDGAHSLEIGLGSGQISPDSHVLMLNPQKPIGLRWRKEAPIPIGASTNLGIIGHCQLNITRPARFYLNFLAELDTIDIEAVIAHMDQTVRTTLADILGGHCQYGDLQDAELQSRLTRLQPADLTEELEVVGLECLHLATYTSVPPVESHSTETSGQLPSFSHN